MSKWDWSKIQACDEIRWGTRLRFLGDECTLWVKDKNFIKFYESQETARVLSFKDSLHNIKFYRPDGTEILPPEDEVKWYVVTSFKKTESAPYSTDYLFKSKEEYLSCNNYTEEDFHWIDIKEYKRNETN